MLACVVYECTAVSVFGIVIGRVAHCPCFRLSSKTNRLRVLVVGPRVLVPMHAFLFDDIANVLTSVAVLIAVAR